MATPSDPTAAGHLRRQAQVVMDFAVELCSKLAKLGDADWPDLPFGDISHHSQIVDYLSDQSSSMTNRMAKNLDKRGRELWNSVGRLRRDESDESKEKSRFLARARCFALQLMELGRGARKDKRDVESDTVNLIELTLSLGKSCIRDEDLDAARCILQKTAEHIEKLKAMPRTTPGAETEQALGKLEMRYLVIRTVLCWKEDRLDVAEHMFRKTDGLRQRLDAPSSELMADALRHIGHELAARGDDEAAILWLRRALEMVDGHGRDRLSTQGLQLRLSLCQGLFQCLLDRGSPEYMDMAADLVNSVESSECGESSVVLHWRLQLLQKSPGEIFDVDGYVALLRRMMASLDFSGGTFYFLLQNIRELRVRDARLACGLLDELLRQQVLPSNKMEWLNKTVVSRVWISTTEAGSAEQASAPEDLKGVFDEILDFLSRPVESDVAGAVHSLMWTKIQALVGERYHGVAEEWCLVALHDVLSSSGEANVGKFQRKLIICAIGQRDAVKARSTFHSMSQTVQDHVLTRYLMFRTSLLGWDYELARASIEHLSKAADADQSRDLLYACVKEAQDSGDRVCVLAALKGVVASWEGGQTPREGNLPSLLRCVIGLIVRINDEATEEESPDVECADELCDMFDKAARYAKDEPRGSDGHRIFTVAELDWFRKNAYNRGAVKIGEWEPAHVVRILGACLALIDCYPAEIDMPLASVTERTLMAMRCHFVMAAGLVAAARAEDGVEEQQGRYVEARRHVEGFDALLQDEASALGEEVVKELVAKASTLFVFDLEAATSLRRWDEVAQIVRKAKVCRDEMMYKAMGDVLLRSRAPGQVMFAGMRLIIDEIYELGGFDRKKLAKYIRCVFQVILPLDDASALQLVDQAIRMAGGKGTAQFPEAELEWLVATTFNHAIDLYARGEDGGCHAWAFKAMDLAGCVDDGGGLRGSLQARFNRLRFG